MKTSKIRYYWKSTTFSLKIVLGGCRILLLLLHKILGECRVKDETCLVLTGEWMGVRTNFFHFYLFFLNLESWILEYTFYCHMTLRHASGWSILLAKPSPGFCQVAPPALTRFLWSVVSWRLYCIVLYCIQYCGVVTSSEWDFNVNLQLHNNPQCWIVTIFVMSFVDIYDTKCNSESTSKCQFEWKLAQWSTMLNCEHFVKAIL